MARSPVASLLLFGALALLGKRTVESFVGTGSSRGSIVARRAEGESEYVPPPGDRLKLKVLSPEGDGISVACSEVGAGRRAVFGARLEAVPLEAAGAAAEPARRSAWRGASFSAASGSNKRIGVAQLHKALSSDLDMATAPKPLLMDEKVGMEVEEVEVDAEVAPAQVSMILGSGTALMDEALHGAYSRYESLGQACPASGDSMFSKLCCVTASLGDVAGEVMVGEETKFCCIQSQVFCGFDGGSKCPQANGGCFMFKPEPLGHPAG
eukprot:Skav225964  [mRNA]  locus=scaffold509:193709:207612:- [translate_table: standard]